MFRTLKNLGVLFMSVWEQRIRQHPVWATMPSLGQVIDQAIATPDIGAEALAGLERVRAALAFIGKRLAAADPTITFPLPLETINANLTAAKRILDEFVLQPAPAGITEINNYIDTALAQATQIPIPLSLDEFGVLLQSVTAFRADFETHLNEARSAQHYAGETTKELGANLATLSSAVQTERDRISKIVTEYQSQFQEGQDARNRDFIDALRQAQTTLTATTTELQGQFSTSQDARNKDFAQTTVEQEKRFTALLDDYRQHLTQQGEAFTSERTALLKTSTDKLDLLKTDFAVAAQNILKEIEDHKAKVEKLVGVIGNLGVTSGYLRAANYARTAMWTWQSVTVLALTALSILAYRTLSVLEGPNGHFNWGGFAGRVLLLTSLGVIAAYAGHQGDKLFTSERRNRRLALELEAIGPFLAPLPQEEQNKFRIQIGDRTFGRDDIAVETGDKSPATVLHVLSSKEGKQVLEIIAGLVKAAK